MSSLADFWFQLYTTIARQKKYHPLTCTWGRRADPCCRSRRWTAPGIRSRRRWRCRRTPRRSPRGCPWAAPGARRRSPVRDRSAARTGRRGLPSKRSSSWSLRQRCHLRPRGLRHWRPAAICRPVGDENKIENCSRLSNSPSTTPRRRRAPY